MDMVNEMDPTNFQFPHAGSDMEWMEQSGFEVERRSKSRITCNFAAIVRGRDEYGREYEENASVINMSAGGAYLKLKREITVGEELAVRIALPTGSLKTGTSKLSTRSVVLRGEEIDYTAYGIAIKFTSYRFL
jgi:hypothetical protein